VLSGFDETANWLICEEGLKIRCTMLISNSDVTEGCWGINAGDVDRNHASVLDRWRSSQIEKPVVEGWHNKNTHLKKTYYNRLAWKKV
jgi:valyl-tRNA synthetase